MVLIRRLPSARIDADWTISSDESLNIIFNCYSFLCDVAQYKKSFSALINRFLYNKCMTYECELYLSQGSLSFLFIILSLPCAYFFGSLNSKIESESLLKRQHFLQSVTVSAGGVATVTMGKYSIPDGYELWGILPDLGGFGDQFLLSITRYNDAIVAKVRNFHTSALTSRISCSVMYVRNS